jgi:uncharacterized RDD family membrane protein YckC
MIDRVRCFLSAAEDRLGPFVFVAAIRALGLVLLAMFLGIVVALLYAATLLDPEGAIMAAAVVLAVLALLTKLANSRRRR